VNVEALMGVALIAIWRSVSEVFDVSAEPGRAMGTGNGFLRGARDAHPTE
jgi:hypothetical protein